MSIRKINNFLLALLILCLALCLAGTGTTGAARAETIYTSSDGSITVTATVEKKTITYTDASGEQKTISYPVIDSSSVSVSVTGLEYDSPNENTTTGTTTEKKYYAWTTDGFVEVSSDGHILDESGDPTDQQASVDLTVSYVPNESTGIYNTGTYTGSDGTNNISADFVGDSSHGNTSDATHGGAIDNVASTSDASLGTITGNFIGNYEDSTTSGEYGGAIANYRSGDSSYTAKIEAITGNFIGNHVKSEKYQAQGGAIYNGGSGTIGDIAGSFIGNFVDLSDVSGNENKSSYAYGGAIYSTGTIGDITGDFIGNYVKLTGPELITTDDDDDDDEKQTTGYASGGAIRSSGTIGDITGDFICNYVEATGVSSASGGAITNSGTIGDIEGDFICNYAKMIYDESSLTTNRTAHGGAINNDSSGSIKSITGDFISNTATSNGDNAFGGAIYNQGTIGTADNSSGIGITGDFIDNHVYGSSEDSTSGAYAYGGAICNYSSSGTIYGIKGDFIGNSAEAIKQVMGGAIYNKGTITFIEGDFIGNYAKTTGNYRAYGGAIYNESGTINAIKGSFIGNYAETNAGYAGGTSGASYSAYGGAIDNTGGKIGTIEGDFISNYANSNANYAYGGAIYNAAGSSNTGGTIESITGNFIGNYAISSSDTSARAVAWGGAIYNTGTISGSVDENDSSKTTAAISANFIENYATSSANDSYGGAIYNNGTIGTTTTGTDGSVSVTVDGISGSTFQGNTANRGGAIYNGTDKSTAESGDGIQEGEYTGIIASITNSSFVKNSATAYGGAIYNYADGAIYNIAKNYFGENEAEDGNGGAIENAEKNSYIGNITGNTFYQNKVTKSDHGGGAIYNEGIIDSLTENCFTENSSGNFGGAIYNNGGTIGGGGAEVGDENLDPNSEDQDVDNPAGAISGNCFSGNTSGRGGAIYNTATRTTVTTTVETDETDETTGENITEKVNVTEIFDLSGENTTGLIMGITGNSFENNIASNFGGAIYNYHGGNIGEISNNYFSGNQANGGNGGAVENAEFDTSIGTMDGNTFVNNTATGNGGAIYNQGTIGIIEDETTGEKSAGDAITNSTFRENSAANGGAIYNSYTSTVASVYVHAVAGTDYNVDADGNFSSFVGSSTAGYLYYTTDSEGKITTVVSQQESYEGYTRLADSSNNPYIVKTVSDSTVNGAGAIGNISNCYFYGNKATSGSGGAIYNASGKVKDADGNETEQTYTATMGTITNTSFVNNSATDKGGAIYSASDLTIAADGASVVFQGNTASNGTDDNAIYMAKDETTGKATTVNFQLSNGGSIYLYDNIQGDDGYGVNISGDGLNNVFYLLNDVKEANLSVGAALIKPESIKPLEADPTDPAGDEDDSSSVTGNLTLSTMNGEAHVYSVSSFTVAGDFNMEADVDLKTETMDHFETTDGTGTGLLEDNDDTNGHSGTLNVSDLNIYTDATKNSVAVYFAEEGLMSSVTSSVSSALGPKYEYDLTYLYKDSSGDVYDQNDKLYEDEDFDTSLLESKDSGGYFVFNNTGRNNPAVVTPAVAQMGTLGAFNMMFDYNFEHSDYYMKLPEDLRLAKIEGAKAKKAARRAKESDATRPEYYNQNELTFRGAWFRTYATNESVSYRGRYTSRDKYWGGLVGFDSDMHEHGNGWASVTTGYVGTIGIRQEFSGGHIKQHGGVVGLTESFYRKNFYTAWTIAAGTTKAHEHTMYGKDKERIDEYGIAARFGWNIDMDYNGKFAILPTFTASYSTVHPEDFTNAGGTKITGSGLRAVQLNPNVKLIWKMNDGWQPYLTVGEVWTVGQTLHMRTDGQKLLDELELRAYAEYGIGVQKRWADEKDAYIQVMGHSDGRDGILVNAGLRWNF